MLFGSQSPRRDRFRRLYGIRSAVVHGSADDPPPDPQEYLNDAIDFLGDEYTIHARSMRPWERAPQEDES